MEEHDEMHKAFGYCVAALVALSVGASLLQWAVPILTRTLSQLEQHTTSILIGVGIGTALYVYIRLKVRSFRRRHEMPQRWPGGQQPHQPVYQFDPRVDRPGLLGTFGRWLAARSGGPVIVSGGRPIGVRQVDVEPDDDEADDDDQEPGEDEADERRVTTRQARAVYSRIIRER